MKSWLCWQERLAHTYFEVSSIHWNAISREPHFEKNLPHTYQGTCLSQPKHDFLGTVKFKWFCSSTSQGVIFQPHIPTSTHHTALIVQWTTEAMERLDKCFHREVEERKSQSTNPVRLAADLGYTNTHSNAFQMYFTSKVMNNQEIHSYRKATGLISYTRSIFFLEK